MTPRVVALACLDALNAAEEALLAATGYTSADAARQEWTHPTQRDFAGRVVVSRSVALERVRRALCEGRCP